VYNKPLQPAIFAFFSVLCLKFLTANGLIFATHSPRIMKRILFFLIASLLFSAFIGDAFDNISSAFRAGDARQLAAYFGPTIDLTLMEREEVYSKGQAEIMLKDFFTKNPPKAFQLVHKGSSQEGTQYGIGQLTSNNGKEFRITFNTRNTNGKIILNELRIELD